jgi:hypothetical protein
MLSELSALSGAISLIVFGKLYVIDTRELHQLFSFQKNTDFNPQSICEFLFA